MWKKTCIVVADRARARFFVTEPPPEHRPDDPRRLVERFSVVDSDGQLPGKELFSNMRSGTTQSAGGRDEFDDHRDAHRQELQRRFARRVGEAAVEFVDVEIPVRVVLAIEPQLLGVLRPEIAGRIPEDMSLVEVAADLSRQAPEQIERVLERHGVWTS